MLNILYVVRNEKGQKVTVNGERYRLTTCRNSGVTLEPLQEKFPERVIFSNGDVGWPPKSCDLTPLDCFICGYLKSPTNNNLPTGEQYHLNYGEIQN